MGAHDLTHGRRCVSAWHEDTFGPWPPSHDAAPGHEVLRAVCDADTTLVTGAPPKNLGAAITREGLRLGRWVAQGGFAGEGVVPPERQLAKFKGLRACPSFNFNGAPKAVLEALASPAIGERRLVSKNVCHGVNYDDDLHARLGAVKDRRQSLGLVWDAMQRYLSRRPEGKLFHDPLAACCALDERIGTWAEVRVLRERGEWAAEPQAGTNTWIITGYDHERFVRTLLAADDVNVADRAR